MSPGVPEVMRLTREIAELNAEVANEACRTTPSLGYLEAWSSRLLKRAAELHTVVQEQQRRAAR
jgi:hypothetical protein